MLLHKYKKLLPLKLFFIIVGVVLLMIYVSWTFTKTNLSTASLVVILDIAPSMNVVDMHGGGQSRLDHAKELIEDLAKHYSAPIGIIAVDSKAHYLVPPTKDTESFLQQLSLLHTRSFGESVWGTTASDLTKITKTDSLTKALELATPGSGHSRSIVLISDMNTTSSTFESPISSSNFEQVVVVALGDTKPQAIIDADGTALPEQAVGRNDAYGKSLAHQLQAIYATNSSDIEIDSPANIDSSSSKKRLLRLGALLVLLWL